MNRAKVLLSCLLVAIFAITYLGIQAKRNNEVEAKGFNDTEITGNLNTIVFYANPKAKNIQEAMQLAGYEYHPEDRVAAFPDIKAGLGSRITIVRAPLITVMDGKRKFEFRSFSKTENDLFTEKKIELAEEDLISTPLQTPVTDNMDIKITRVAIVHMKNTEPIAFQEVTKNDKTINMGQTKVSQTGVAGVKTFTYEIRREDGIEVSRQLVNTEITTAPVNKITLIGTKPYIYVPCAYNSLVLDASIKNGIDPNKLCYRMLNESNGNPNSDGGIYKGLFQYEQGLWDTVSVKAGYSGASIWDAKSQIYVTAWAWANGYRGRWPNP